jgi:uncharacterized protein (DUF433 family)
MDNTGCTLILADPAVMLGKPVIAGAHITVEHIRRELAAGTTIEHLVEMHPTSSRAAIIAALEYAA